MISVTQTQQAAIDAGRYKHFARFTLANSTTLTLGEDEIWENGYDLDYAVSGQSAFELGSCIVNQFKLDIYNPNGQYYNTDFLGTRVYAYIELYDTNMTTVIGTIQKGYFVVTEADTNGSFIKLTCLDDMRLLDRPYSVVTTAYPATLYNIANGIATTCGLTLSLDGSTWLPTGISSSYTVTVRPSDENMTCRDVLSAVCQATGNYATIDRTTGNLLITRYDTAFIAESGSDYSNYDYHDITTAQLTKFSRDEAQVTLTGVSVEAEQTAYTAGTSGYMVYVKDNPMINAGSEQTFATALNSLVNGWNFRQFDATHLTNMLMEAGDNIVLTDTLGNSYKSIITHTEYSAGNNQRTECNAEPAAVNSATRYSAAAKAAATEIKNYDSTVNNYIDLVSKGLGMYRSLITDPDDASSQIYAFHDEETFANSTFCMFENANGIQVGRRDTTSDPWTYTSADVEDAVVLAQTLVANTAIINQLFSEDITVTGKLHSSDYVAGTGSPPYSQAGMGINFATKQYQARNFAIDAGGNLYARSGKIGAFHLTTWTDQGGNVIPYFVTDFAIWYSSSDSLYHRARLCLSTPNAYNGNVDHESIWIEEYVSSNYNPSNPSAATWAEDQPPFLVNSAGTITVTTPPDLYQAAKVGASTTQGLTFYDYFFSPGDTPSAHFKYQSPLGFIGKDTVVNSGTGYPGLLINSSARLNLTAPNGVYANGDLSVSGNVDNYGLITKVTTNNITNGSANDTWSFWFNKGSCYALFTSTGQLVSQPSQYGMVLNFVSSNEVFQIWHTQPSGGLYWRGANANTTAMPSWTRVATTGQVTDTLRVVSVTKTNFSIAANGTATAEIEFTVPTYFSYVAIQDVWTDHTNTTSAAGSANCFCYNHWVSGTTASAGIRNLGSSAAKVTVHIDILCRRTS